MIKQIPFYPIPYFEDLAINAPEGTVFDFTKLKNVLPKDEWLALGKEERLRNVLNVIQELEQMLGIKIEYNVIVED